MNDATKTHRMERTPEDKAEETRIREQHRQHPFTEVPSDTVRGADAMQLLRFAASIRRVRESQGLSVEEVAARSGIEAGVISRFEAGHSFNPTLATLYKLAAALGRKLTVALEEPS